MRKILNGFLSILLLSCGASLVCAQPYEGKIIDVFDNKVTVMVEDGHHLKPGDEVSLAYLAGVIEMDLGQYQVIQAPGNAFIAEVVINNIVPSKQMKVKVYPIGRQELTVIDYQGNTGKLWVDAPKQEDNLPDPAGMDPRGITLLGETIGGPQGKDDFSVFDSPKNSVDRSVKIPGEVSRVMGKKVEVSFSGTQMPEAGWLVDLTYVTTQGKELPVGTWKIVEVKGQSVIAEEHDAMGKPRMGLKASIYCQEMTEGEKASGSEPSSDFLQEAERIQDFLSSTTDKGLFSAPKNVVYETDPFGSDQFQPVVEDTLPDLRQVLKNAGKIDGIERKWILGIDVANIDHQKVRTYLDEGVAVVKVFPNSPAEQAGILPGDVIFKIRNVKVNDVNAFLRQLQMEQQNTYFWIDRNFEQRKIKVKLKKL